MGGNWTVFRGAELILALQKGGRELTIVPPPGDPALAAALAIYPFLLGRQFSPISSVTVETVNGAGATTSPYADDLRRVGFGNDYRGMTLWKR
jgi:hypothetical protein